MAGPSDPDVRHSHWHRNFRFPPSLPSPGTTSLNPRRLSEQPIHRHVGDGFDFRRPIMSQPTENVIDLTNEPSSPADHVPGFASLLAPRRAYRTTRNIVDLDNDDDSPQFQSERTRQAREPSPELELLFSRPLASAPRPRSPSITASLADGDRARNAAGSAASMVERAMAGLQQNLAPYSRALNRSFGTLSNLGGVRQRNQHPAHHHHHHNHHDHHDHHHHLHRHDRHAHQVPNEADLFFLQDPANAELILPQNLDFEAQGFHMGRSLPRSSVPPPTYDPPPSPRPGFTRTPKEGEVLICPNCSDELGVGENDLKRQVWVMKSCGHVS